MISFSERAMSAIRAADLNTRLDGLVPSARQLVEAPTHAHRAQLLLRLSDGLVLEEFDALKEACEEATFPAGSNYLANRIAVLCATREADGTAPAAMVANMEIWRRGIVALAGGAR